MYCTTNAPVSVKNVLNGFNDTGKCYLKEQIKPLGKPTCKDTPNI